MMSKLGLHEGGRITLDSVRLPKGEYVQLRPHSASWVDIPIATREAILAEQLRNYQTLSPGDTISLADGTHSNQFDVIAVRPLSSETKLGENSGENSMPAGISIVDAELSIDVIEPSEAYSPITTIVLTTPDSSVSAVATAVTTGELAQGACVTFALRLDQPLSTGLLVEATCVDASGDVDLYISHSPDNTRPSPLDHTWKAQNHGDKRLQIEASDSRLQRALREGWLYITVYAYTTPSDSCARFALTCKQASQREGRQLLREVLSDEQAGGGRQCSHCRREVPVASFELHEMACARFNWRCEECGIVLPLIEKDKHSTLAHVVAECECGMRLSPNELYLHKESHCSKRLVGCLYCDLQVPLDQRGEHQGVCGNRTVTCTLCRALYKRNVIKKHLVEEHGIYPQEATDDYYTV